MSAKDLPSESASTPADGIIGQAVSVDHVEFIQLQDLISTSVKAQLGGFLADIKKEMSTTKRNLSPPPREENNDEPPPKKSKPSPRSHADALMADSESESGEEKEASGSEEDDDKEWLQELAQSGKSDEKGPPVSEKIANAINEVLANKVEEKQLKALEERNACPSNIPLLTSQRVNECIWTNLKFNVRRKDIKHAQLQEKIAQSSTAMTRTLQTLQNCRDKSTNKEERREIKEAMMTCLDAVNLNTTASQEISQLRRSELKESLNPQFKALCKTPATEASELFGDKLAERIREINELNKMGLDLTKKPAKSDYRSRYDHESSKSDICVKSQIHDQPILCFRQQEHAGAPAAGEEQPQRRLLQQQECKGEEPSISGQKEFDKLQEQRAVETLINVSTGSHISWENFKAATLQRGTAETNDFKAGRLRDNVVEWKKLTNDPRIISLIAGTKIEFDEEIEQANIPTPYKFELSKEVKIDHEIAKLLGKGVIERTDLDHTGFVSNIFTRDKPDGSLRLILDLSELNESVTYRHFKMENLNTAINLMIPNCQMASIDWKDAYYSVPIAFEHRKYLQFIWKGQTSLYLLPQWSQLCPKNLYQNHKGSLL
jgi:hypothetical protein